MGVRPPSRPARLRPRPVPPEIAARTPPGQFITQRFPVLHYGDVPDINPEDWRLTVDGLVERPLSLSRHDLEHLPTEVVTADMHCVTRWSRLDIPWGGIPAQALLAACEPMPSARFVVVSCAGGYDTNLPLSDFDAGDVLLATTLDGEPLTPEHGFPLRLVVPKRYAWKSAKWVTGLRFLAGDEPGFWERYGYHNDADPWREQRFSDEPT
ncbi:MAG: Sulfite oxidase and related enzymes [uncultured Thermomicrobiales bacterium]|uniref:Sulfite oxidase and related enzymes n=1 Tax=uncultured Thermomicrobiales bacterium TaxID=1645740 RepID=A0A6J4V4R0_9BACT|nr:MAG: Sulfite oxidase and related enzymes [uncultured Thermomicrobiales bacterium]